MRLFRNKKGLDYCALLAIFVIIAMVFLFIQVYNKLDIFELRIGDQELALMNTYQEADKMLLFVDQSAKYSVYHALEKLADNGGFKAYSPGGFIGPIIYPDYSFEQVNYWFKDDKKYYKDINFYDNFEYYFNSVLDSYLDKNPAYIHKDNYELTITDDKVLGIPEKPVLLPLFVSPEKKEHYADVMKKVSEDIEYFKGMGMTSFGAYVVRPSFSLDIETRMSDYELLEEKTDMILDCVDNAVIVNDVVVASCVDTIKSDEFEWVYARIPGTSTYSFNVGLKNLQDPFSKKRVVVKFALEFSD